MPIILRWADVDDSNFFLIDIIDKKAFLKGKELKPGYHITTKPIIPNGVYTAYVKEVDEQLYYVPIQRILSDEEYIPQKDELIFNIPYQSYIDIFLKYSSSCHKKGLDVYFEGVNVPEFIQYYYFSGILNSTRIMSNDLFKYIQYKLKNLEKELLIILNESYKIIFDDYSCDYSIKIITTHLNKWIRNLLEEFNGQKYAHHTNEIPDRICRAFYKSLGRQRYAEIPGRTCN